MGSAGPRYCGTGANFNDGGVSAWSNPTNIQGDTAGTSSNATIGNTAASSQKLRASNFGFTVDGAATISGVLVECDRRAFAANYVDDNNIQLLIAGTESGTNKSTGTLWVTTQGFVSFGGSSDLWGNSLTSAIVNAVGFGASFKCVAHGVPAGNSLAAIFRVRITVYFLTNYVMAVDPGSYSTTGTPASVLLNRVLPTEAGSFTIAGSSAALLFHRLVTAESGIYSYDGVSTALLYQHVLPVDSGVYNVTGTAASLLKHYLIGVESGVYTITGKSIAFWNKDSKVLVVYTPETGQVTVFTSETAESTSYTLEEI